MKQFRRGGGGREDWESWEGYSHPSHVPGLRGGISRETLIRLIGGKRTPFFFHFRVAPASFRHALQYQPPLPLVVFRRWRELPRSAHRLGAQKGSPRVRFDGSQYVGRLPL